MGDVWGSAAVVDGLDAEGATLAGGVNAFSCAFAQQARDAKVTIAESHLNCGVIHAMQKVMTLEWEVGSIAAKHP